MKIKDILKQEKNILSFEVFPPKAENTYESVKKAVHEIAKLKPAFMSVTYGAGGGTSRFTMDIASDLLRECGITPMVHLTGVSLSRAQLRKTAEQIKDRGIENILSLRGDIPEIRENDYNYASELIHDLKELGDFCIGGTCYPEGHPESASMAEDLRHLKEKTDAGCDFLTSQMFFDNTIFYNFLYRAREKGITVPIIAGIMPITNVKQLKRTVSLSATHLPARFRRLLDKFGDNPNVMKQAGIAYTTEQIVDLVANGIQAIHIYTMNHPDVAEQIRKNLSEILG